MTARDGCVDSEDLISGKKLVKEVHAGYAGGGG